ncbi:MAG: hypothetical protein P8174_11185, partial [Gemmatimonadota bacterium]
MTTSARWPAVVGLSLVVLLPGRVMPPWLVVFAPLGLLLVAMAARPPRLHLLALGVLLLVLTMASGHADMMSYAQRGWVLVLGAWFIAMVLAWPQASFISRALGAVAGSTGTAALVFL